MINIGIHDILKDQNDLQFESLTRNILEISQKCKEHGIEEIIISSLVVTKRIDPNLLPRANASLCNMCRENSFCFVDNSNISVDNSFKNKLHILDSRKTILANNFFILCKQLFSVDAHTSSTLLTGNGSSKSERQKCTDLQIMYENRLKHL